MVGRRGFEPLISALRGRCPGPLDERPTRARAGPWPMTARRHEYSKHHLGCKGLRQSHPLRIIEMFPFLCGRLAQLVRAPRSHRGGRRFKSSIAHQPKGTWEPRALVRTPAGRGGGTADALRSGRSILTDVWVQIPPSAPSTNHALVAQWIERCPAEAEVVSSNLAKRTIPF